ncbi:hypothetical protein KHQ82_00235 [Mycoplasmatota bacterium]|nr:hypothetical protein KHQ82_00235 [Mycoplasmatota bacterium]
MKNIMLLLILLLTGCACRNIDENPNMESPITDNKDLVDNELSDVIEYKYDLKLKDLSIDYDLDYNTLKAYSYSKNEGITYINIEDFITFLSGSIEETTVEKANELTLSFEIEIDSDLREYFDDDYYIYKMIINGNENTVYLNDVDMLESWNVYPQTDYTQGLEVVDYKQNDVDYSREIDLDDYEMDIVMFENSYYIPLYLANFFLTGDAINIYEVEDTLLLFDQQTTEKTLLDEFKNKERLNIDYLNHETYNYLALYFDYFYGLQEFKDMNNIYDILNSYDIEDATKYTNFYYEVNSFINELNDLHTMLVSAGYNYPDYQRSYYLEEGSKLVNYVEALNSYYCFLDDETVRYTVIDDVAYITINGFTLDIPELLSNVMEDARNYDDIVIDLKCNGGGLISSAIHVLTYMTDDPIPVGYLDPETGSMATIYYKSIDSNFLDKNYYVVSSKATFSAANLFTSIVKDNELGTIIGDTSLGGACAIQYTVTPDGSIFTSSSNTGLINRNGLLIENGIEPDIFLIELAEDEIYEQSVVNIIKSKR